VARGEDSVEQANISIIVRRKRYDVSRGSGFVDLEIEGKLHRFRIYQNPQRRGIIIEYNGIYDSLSNLKRLLKGTELERYTELIAKYIRSAIYEAQIRESRKHRIIIMKSIQTSIGLLEIGLRDDGKLVLKLGNKRVLADRSNLDKKLEEILPLDAMTSDLVSQIQSAFKSIESSIISSEDVVIVLDSEAKDIVLPSAIVDDKLVTMIPFTATYIDEDGEMRRGLLVLVIVVDSNGEVKRVDKTRNPVAIEVNGRTIYKDFLERIVLNEAIERLLPDTDLVRRICEELERGRSVTWSEAWSFVEELMSKYVYVEGRNKIIAMLYAIAQIFYDLVTIFAILRIIGEMGSGKRQLANAIAACAIIALTVVKPSEAALYRLVDSFHPLLIIDESKINEDMALLLNAGFERDKFVPRARITEDGKITIDVFNFYSPKIVVSRPGKLSLPEDTISRTVEVYMQRIATKTFPLEINPKDREEAVIMMLLLKIRKWKEFVDTYNMLRDELIGTDPRTRDTYLPLLTVAYLVSKERSDPSLFIEVLEDMIKTADERAGVTHHQRLAIVGILEHVVSSSTLEGTVKLVSVSTKDIASALGMKLDSSTRIRIGKFLREAPFKVSMTKSGGYTKYLIDVEKLYQYVLSYGVDISMLADEELEKLKNVTGYDWKGVGFNKNEWIKSIVKKLFGEQSGGHQHRTLHPLHNHSKIVSHLE